MRKVWAAVILVYLAWMFGAPYLPPTSLIGAPMTAVPPFVPILPLVLMLAVPAWKLAKRKADRWEKVVLAVGAVSAIASLDIALPLQASSSPVAFRAMTLNVEFHSRQMPQLAEAIRDHKIDIVLLQEANSGSDGPTQYLLDHLVNWHAVQAGEVAILSRWELKDVRKTPLPGIPNRFLLSAEVGAPSPFRVYNIHLAAPQWSRGLASMSWYLGNQTCQLAVVRQELKSEKLPFILGGDFNTSPRGPNIRTLSSEYTNAFDTAGLGLGWTYPSHRPVIRIDHLFSSANLQPIRSRVGPSCSSDHRSVITDYAYK